VGCPARAAVTASVRAGVTDFGQGTPSIPTDRRLHRGLVDVGPVYDGCPGRCSGRRRRGPAARRARASCCARFGNSETPLSRSLSRIRRQRNAGSVTMQRALRRPGRRRSVPGRQRRARTTGAEPGPERHRISALQSLSFAVTWSRCVRSASKSRACSPSALAKGRRWQDRAAGGPAGWHHQAHRTSHPETCLHHCRPGCRGSPPRCSRGRVPRRRAHDHALRPGPCLARSARHVHRRRLPRRRGSLTAGA